MFAEDIALTQDGRFAVVSDGGFSPRLASLDVANRTLVELFYMWDRSDPENLPDWYANAVAIAPDGTVVVADYFTGKVNTLTIDGSGHLTPVASYDLPLETVDGDPYIERPVNVAIAPDGQTVLTGSCQVDWVSVYRITSPGVLSYVGKVSGLPPVWHATDKSWRGSQQSLTFSGDGSQAYVLTNGRFSPDPDLVDPTLPPQVSILDILGPGNVALHTSGAASLGPLGSSQLFGVDVLAAASGKVYVGNPTVSEGVDYLNVVNLSTFAVSQLPVGFIPTGVATCGLGKLIVEKQVLPDGTAGSFSFSGAAEGAIGDGGQIEVLDVAPGLYVVSEADPGPEFELMDITCDDGDSSGDLYTRTATFNVQAGEAVKCTFTNALRSLLVTKEVEQPASGVAGLGQVVRFLITVQNNGGVAVESVPLRDEYDPDCLVSLRAQAPPDVHGGSQGFLQWDDVGPLAPGEATSLWVEFTTKAACGDTLNAAKAQAEGLWFTGWAPLRILESVARAGGRVFHDEVGAGALAPEYRGVENAEVTTDGQLYVTNTSGWYSFNMVGPGTYHAVAAPPVGSWWIPTTAEACDMTIVNNWDQAFCNFGYWWGLDGPPVDGLAAQQQVTLAPVQDTTISGPEPGNHGAEETLWVRQPGLSSTLVQFDVSGLPAGAEVVWAKLRLYAFTASNPDNRLYLTAYPVSKLWAEGEATWDQAAAGVPWEAAGAVGAGDHGAPVGWAWTNTLGWVTFDLDPVVVAGWLADPGGNQGLLLRGEGTITRKVAYWFLSKEHGNGAAHPQLVIGYNLP